MAPACIILGLQWGDEGKGKLVDILSQTHQIVARCNGGSNAGHTVVVGDKMFKLHLLPSGILHDSTEAFIGNGVVVHVGKLFQELDDLTAKDVSWEGRFFVSDRAHVLLPIHIEIDGFREAELTAGNKIGTTKQGIGPCYADKINRVGMRVCDLMAGPEAVRTCVARLATQAQKRYGIQVDLEEAVEQANAWAERLRPHVVNGVEYMQRGYMENKSLLIEGANGTMLDIDFGTYPYVTSSNCSAGGAVTGLGIPPVQLQQVFGVVKAYCTRVGAGPFPTELHDELGSKMGKQGHEFGTTTGRPRRCGWIDLVALRYACMINGVTLINLSKLDVLSGFKEICIGVKYIVDNGEPTNVFPARIQDLEKVEMEYEVVPGWDEDITEVRNYTDLPLNARRYVERLEHLLETKIMWIGVGPARDAMISKH